jgi:hypothetical protein
MYSVIEACLVSLILIVSLKQYSKPSFVTFFPHRNYILRFIHIIIISEKCCVVRLCTVLSSRRQTTLAPRFDNPCNQHFELCA